MYLNVIADGKFPAARMRAGIFEQPAGDNSIFEITPIKEDSDEDDLIVEIVLSADP